MENGTPFCFLAAAGVRTIKSAAIRSLVKGGCRPTNRVTNALRMAASTLRLSNTYLGAQFRRLELDGGPDCDQGYGRQAGSIGLPACSATGCNSWTKSGVLRGPHRKLQINYLQVESRQNLGFQIVEAPAA